MGREEIGGEVQGQYVLFKPAVENLTEPLTPVTADVLAMFFAPAIQFIRGWAYLNLKYVRPMLPFKLSDEDLVNQLYLGSAAHIPVTRLALLKLPLLLLAGIYAYFTFGVVFARTRNMPDNFMENFRKLCRTVAENPACGPIETIHRLWFLPQLFDQIGNMPLFVNFSAAQYILLLTLLKMFDRHQSVRERFLEYPPEQVLSKLRTEPEAKGFLAHLDRFLAQNGHRALKELELQSVRWEENPTQVVGMIRNYISPNSGRIPDFITSARSTSFGRNSSKLKQNFWIRGNSNVRATYFS